MPDQFVQPNGDFVVEGGDVVVKDDNNVVRIRLDSETGSIFIHNRDGDLVFHWEMRGNNLRFGGHNRDGDLLIFDKTATNLSDLNQAIFHFNSQRGVARLGGNEIAGQLICLDADGNQTVFLDGTEGNIVVGANGQDGNLFVQNANNHATIRLNGVGGNIIAGGDGEDGDLFLRNGSSKTTIHLDGAEGNIIAGGDNKDGDLFIRNNDDENVIHLNGQHSRLIIKNNEGKNAIELDTRDTEGPGSDTTLARLKLGGRGSQGRLQMFRADDTQLDFTSATVELDGKSGSLSLGSTNAGSVDGQLIVFGSNGEVGFSATGKGLIDVGDDDSSGSIFVSGGSSTGGATDAVAIHGNQARVRVGSGAGSGVAGKVDVVNSSGETTIHLDGQAGDISFANGDLAEEFGLASGEASLPGALMVLDDDANLRRCSTPYDPRVAGIAAGAGAAKPAIVLGRKSDDVTDRIALALTGKVYCYVDADWGPVAVGDLLTTSPTSGHAMLASDPSAANGSIIGKALAPLEAGRSLISVLVSMR